MYDQLQKEELGFRKERFKKVYLVLYNMFQFCGFMYILIVMGIRYYRDGVASMPGTYEAVGNAFKFIQLIQYLEVMHPIFGYTKGGAMVPFMQVTGRAFVLFAMIDHEPRMMTKPVVFYLFIIWSVIEIVRYPYYLTQLLKVELGILTWLRYFRWSPVSRSKSIFNVSLFSPSGTQFGSRSTHLESYAKASSSYATSRTLKKQNDCQLPCPTSGISRSTCQLSCIFIWSSWFCREFSSSWRTCRPFEPRSSVESQSSIKLHAFFDLMSQTLKPLTKQLLPKNIDNEIKFILRITELTNSRL